MAEFKEKGNESFKAQDYPKALEFYSQAISIEPNNHVYYSNRSACYFNMNKFEEALKEAEKCVELNGKWGKGYQRKGAAEGKLQRFWSSFVSYSIGNLYDPTNTVIQSE